MQGMMQREVVMHHAAGQRQGKADRFSRARANSQEAATSARVEPSLHAKATFQSTQIEAKGAIFSLLK